MQKRKRDIEELKKLVKASAKDVISNMKKGILKKSIIRRLDVSANILTDMIKEYENNEQL